MTELEIKRKQNNYTQQQVAEEIDVSIGCYNMYENNQRKVPIEKAERLANLFKCKIDDIFLPSTFTASEIKVKETT